MCAHTWSFDVGTLRCHVIDDGVSTYATAAFLFASAPTSIREAALREAGEDPEAIHCSNACLLVEGPRQRVLIDAGSGVLAQSRAGRENLGRLFAGLEDLGVGAREIDTVVLTHLHSDHLWGCFGPTGKRPFFSAARHVVHRAEWAGAHPSLVDDLRKLGLRIALAESDGRIAPGIRLIDAPGHSPGHCALHVQSEGEDLLCVGDAVAHPLNLEHAEWTMAHEAAADLAIASRRMLLDLALQRAALVHAFHMPFPSVGRIARKAAGYAWSSLSAQPQDKEEP